VLLERDARDSSFFASQAILSGLAAQLETPARSIAILLDEEHNLYTLAVEERSNGYGRRYQIGFDFVTTGEYRTLLAAHRELKDIGVPLIVSGIESEADEAAPDAPGPAAEAATASGPAGPHRAKAADTRIESLDGLVEYFIAAGKRGVAINRYKGLGEMNPAQLWETTMRPETRTLLQVRAEDHTEADQMFTTLMGDQVEPRRRFIEDNALDVKNLDV
jgi:DNA gyrase subunit B